MNKIIFAAMLLLLSGIANAQAPLKMGHINTSKLLDTLQSRKDAIKMLQEFSKRGEEELTTMEAELQKAVVIYQKSQPTNTATMNQFEEEKLQKKQMALQSREQELQQQMTILSNDLNAPILKRLQKAVDLVADRKKINYIIDENQAVYAKGGIDLTNEVMIELLKMDKEETKTTGTTVTPPIVPAPPVKTK